MPHLSREGAGPGPRGACRVQSMFFCTAQVAGDLFLGAVTSAWTGQPSSTCLVPSAGERGMGPVSPTETKPPHHACMQRARMLLQAHPEQTAHLPGSSGAGLRGAATSGHHLRAGCQ